MSRLERATYPLCVGEHAPPGVLVKLSQRGDGELLVVEERRGDHETVGIVALLVITSQNIS